MQLKHTLAEYLIMNDLEIPTLLRGIEIILRKGAVCLRQKTFIDKLFQNSSMKTSKALKTIMRNDYTSHAE